MKAFPNIESNTRKVRLFVAVCVCCMGCNNADFPAIPVREVRYWQMPTVHHKVPAPRSVEINGDEVYVLDTSGQVLVFLSDGSLARSWFMPEYVAGRPEDLIALRDGRIAIADTHYHRILFTDTNGVVLGSLGEYGKGPGQFDYPVALTEDAQGNLYVAEYGGNDRVQKFNPAGEFVLSFGAFGTKPGEFQRPSGLAWRNNEIFVADAINNQIQVFRDDGTYSRRIDIGQGYMLNYPYDIELAGKGDFVVIEYGAGCVTHLSTGGILLGRWSQAGPEEIPLATPWGVAVDSSRIVIADTGNRRLVELRK